MDLTHISLFTGIGGIDLGLEWAGFRTIATCNNRPFPYKLLKKRFPNAIHHTDIYETDFTVYANHATILSGGFPCQPFSIAGLRRGSHDDRYLWPEMRRAYREAQPSWIIAENVPGITSMALKNSFSTVENSAQTIRYYQNILPSIIEQLEADGYSLPSTLDGQPIILSIPAAGVNAPHKRQRIFIIAHKNSNSNANGKLQAAWSEWFNGNAGTAGKVEPSANHNGIDFNLSGFSAEQLSQFETSKIFGDNITINSKIASNNNVQRSKGRCGSSARPPIAKKNRAELQLQADRLCPQWIAANALCTGRKKGEQEYESELPYQNDKAGRAYSNANLSGQEELSASTISGRQGFNTGLPLEAWSSWPTQSPICGGDDGIPNRVDRLESLGNAVVPQIPYIIGSFIREIEELLNE